jgi:hypothetical protein
MPGLVALLGLNMMLSHLQVFSQALKSLASYNSCDFSLCFSSGISSRHPVHTIPNICVVVCDAMQHVCLS